MNIILTGFMGTGKTAVGKRLAKRLGWQFHGRCSKRRFKFTALVRARCSVMWHRFDMMANK